MDFEIRNSSHNYNDVDLKDYFISIKDDSLVFKIYQCKQEYRYDSRYKCDKIPNESISRDLDLKFNHILELCECQIAKYFQKEEIDRFLYMESIRNSLSSDRISFMFQNKFLL